MDRKLKILIVGTFQFPFGSASASRIRTIAKGLIASGARVHVITNIRIPSIEKHRSNNNFEYEGITYESTNISVEEASKSSRIIRIYNNIISNKKSRRQVEYYIKNESFDILYIYSRSAIKNIPLVLAAKRYGASVFYDMVEWLPAKAYPYGLINPFFYNDWLGRLFSPFWCNGVIAITTFISKKYKSYKIPCIVVPSVFEFKNTSLPDKKVFDKEFTLLYAGACKAGDGFGRLIDAVKIAASKGCPVKLNVIGTDGNSGRAARYRMICEKDDYLKNRVVFKGRVPDESYIDTLSESTCLVLPRPNIQIVKASFPTRLPEFLSTGRPVLTTNVPDVPLYLEANKEAIIVSGDSAEALAEGILVLWREPEKGESIGRAGKERGQIEFNYLTRTNAIYRFIQKNSNKI